MGESPQWDCFPPKAGGVRGRTQQEVSCQSTAPSDGVCERYLEPQSSGEPTPLPLPQHPTFGAPTACEWASCSWSKATVKSSSSTGNPAVQKSLSTSSLSPSGKLVRKEKGRTQALPHSWHYQAGCSPCPLPPPALLPVLPQGLDAGTSSPAAVGQQGTEISQHKTL